MKLQIFKSLLGIVVSIFLLIGCGGGDVSTKLPQAKIDKSNQKQVIAILFDSIDITTPQLFSPTSTSSEVSMSLVNTSQASLAKILPNYKSLAVSSTDDSYICKGGGSISSDIEGEVSTVIYENCKEENTTINGQIKISYNEATKEITYVMSNYSMIGVNSEYATESTTYVVSAGNINYNTTGKSIVDNMTVEFDNYNYTIALVNNRIDISLDGFVKTSSLDGWVRIKTSQPMQLTDNTCPASGEIDIDGDNSKLKVQFKSNKSVDIYMNSALTEQFEDCSKIPSSLEEK